ncbi:MAG: energy transducer TonB [Bacteroidetes bacterium]|nr:energy transducer TonB [Bacteroidota bacterium]
MKAILIYLVQMIAVSGLLYGYYHFALRNNKFHQYNRFYLLAATVISLVIPFLNIPFYFTAEEKESSFLLQTITVISPATSAPGDVPVYTPSQESSGLSLSSIVWYSYLLVIALLLFRFLFSLLQIRRIIRKYPSEQLGEIRFLNTTEPGTPYSFFHWLFWNRNIELNSAKGEQVFRHELFHITQKHSYDIMYAELLTTLGWFNPFFHLMKKELKAIHEFLADQFAVHENKKWEYAEFLLMHALQTNHSLVNPFFHTQIKRRIAMITKPATTGHQYARKLLVIPIAVITFALFAFSYHEKAVNSGNSPQLSSDTTIPTKQAFLWGSKPGQQIQLNARHLWISNDAVKRITDQEKALVIINGETTTIQRLRNKTVNADSIFIYRSDNPKAISLYGEKARDGAMVFVNAVLTDGLQTIPDVNSNIIFTKVETAPSFVGGDNAWKNFLQKNLDASIPVKNNAPTGNYSVIIMFTVDKNGAISNISPLTKYGYGMEKEAMRVIQLSPIWNPANQNGQIVKAIHKQPVTFVVNKKDGTVSPTPATADDNRIFSKVEIEPYFPGGEIKFREYVQSYQKNHAKEVGAPASPQPVMVEFIVRSDGRISDVKLAAGTPSSAYATAAVELIKNSPNWNPGVQNGRPVNAYKRQAVIFVSPNTQLPSTSQWVEASGETIPKISIEELRQATVHQLLALPADAVIVSYTFTIDTDDGRIMEFPNNGPYFSSGTKDLIMRANAGKIISLDRILIRENGMNKKMVSRVYKVVN